MTDFEKLHYRKIAADWIKDKEHQLNLLKSMILDDATKNDHELHTMFIEYQCGNIERLEYEVYKMIIFINEYLRPNNDN